MKLMIELDASGTALAEELLEELEIAAEESESIRVQTAGGSYPVEVVSVEEDAR